MAALTIAASAALAAPPAAIAEPASTPAPIAETPQAAILTQARTLLATLNPPEQLKATLEKVITFLDGSGGGGPALPPSDGPVISQFFYPTVGKGCMGAASNSVGAALAVPGPATLPPPGPKAGQTGFVFTALGTKALTPQQNSPIAVQWVNLDTGKSGSTPLTDEAKINTGGPVTLSAIADTGSGRIAAVLSGSLTGTADVADPTTCSFLPTLGFFTVA